MPDGGTVVSFGQSPGHLGGPVRRAGWERILDIIAEPNIAFLLLTLGSLAIVAEVFHPSLVMGIVGAISLVLAFLSLGSLPTNWAGVGLILFGFVLLAAEVFVSGFGALGVGGAIAVGLGGWILMAGNEMGVQVSRWLVIALALVVAAFVVFVIGAIVRIRRMPSQSNIHKLVGARAETRSRLDPSGQVTIQGERWDATAEEPPIEAGVAVIVTHASGLRLTVRPDPSDAPPDSPATEEGQPQDAAPEAPQA